METSEIEDMIINCVALGFILQIDARPSKKKWRDVDVGKVMKKSIYIYIYI